MAFLTSEVAFFRTCWQSPVRRSEAANAVLPIMLDPQPTQIGVVVLVAEEMEHQFKGVGSLGQ